jgi:hypothetical protein
MDAEDKVTRSRDEMSDQLNLLRVQLEATREIVMLQVSQALTYIHLIAPYMQMAVSVRMYTHTFMHESCLYVHGAAIP